MLKVLMMNSIVQSISQDFLLLGGFVREKEGKVTLKVINTCLVIQEF